jgi:two-component system, NarL family, response regulator NreC
VISVLLADDHAVVREGIRMVVASQGDMQVIGEAADGREAVRMALDMKPDVVVMDVGMPVLDGIEATARILGGYPAARVVILTVHEDEEYLVRALKVGGRGFVPKRAAGQDLVTAIRAASAGETYIHPTMAGSLVEDYLRRTQDGGSLADGLTAREVEVLTLVAEGQTNVAIAHQLSLSVKTIQAHRANIMRKLDVHDRTALVRYAVRKGLIAT